MTSRRFDDAPRLIKKLSARVETLERRPRAAGPTGVIGYEEKTSNQNITTLTNVAGLQVVADIPAGRRVKVTVYVSSLATTVSTDAGQVHLDKNGSSVQQMVVSFSGNSTTSGAVLVFIDTPTADEHTYTAQYTRVGTGTHTWNASSSTPSFILVEDLGPA